MYKNLCAEALGISGRQSELIELALTYGFKGMDVDLDSIVKQIDIHGKEHAVRYLDSGDIRIAPFELPVRWREDEATFNEDLKQLPRLAEYAASVGTLGFFTVVMPASDQLPYHENFEFHRERFTAIADALAPHDVRLGLDMVAAPAHRADLAHQFIHSPDALLTLAKTVGVANIGVVVDMWQWYVGGGSISQLKDLTADQIVLVRAADVPLDVSLETITDDQRVLTGKGQGIDIVDLRTALENLGYEGPVTPSPYPTQSGGGTRDAIVRAASKSLEPPKVDAIVRAEIVPEDAAATAKENGEAVAAGVEENSA